MDNHSFQNYEISRKKLTNQQRQAIFEALLQYSYGGQLERGLTKVIATQFKISTRTVQRIWERAKSSIINGGSVDISRRFPKRAGRKRVEIDFSTIMEIPLRCRTNIRSLSTKMKVAKSTLHRRIKEGVIKAHSNALKPHLTDDNKLVRLKFCLSMLQQESLNDAPVFENMCNMVHIDEKWFYMTKESEKYYLHPEEEHPMRTCRSKKFIVKVMFLAAVARPRFDCSRNKHFDGKIGIFPFAFKEPAKRNSKNRVAGTLETKPILSVTKEVYRRCLIDNVLPAIRAKWPQSDVISPIFIQQDNAKPHIDPMDVEFIEAATREGFDIRLSFQPPNSPDMNVLDLGYFRAIQSLQHQEAPNSIDELISAVEKSFDELSSESLNNVFLTLQLCMLEVMKNCGGNNYKVPHIGKQRLIRDGNLPLQIGCDKELIDKIIHYLQA
ncbi:uncharacterized protein LOC113769299 [Coffea eugenioides]|uniref:uncharacterized protein LOC113769299 n=1 Tax=Coffea eugenioides TaxID=49369 RepID=UPI000F6068D3|nr:uncharacterized protein LOC113769299 [Coffea eugenioides]